MAGPAKSKEEDLELTIKVIMDHIQEQDGGVEEEPSKPVPKEAPPAPKKAAKKAKKAAPAKKVSVEE